MKIKTWIKYEEAYLPPRCRKLRYRECEEYVNINLREIEFSNLCLAFEDTSYEGKGKIYFYQGKLYYKATINSICAGGEEEYGYNTPLEALKWWNEHGSKYFKFDFDRIHYGMDTSKESVIKLVKNDMKKYILVDGELYILTSEPRYCVVTFGLGHNHGGTGMFCDYHYNSNISNDNYFPATEGEAAVTYANKVAAGRGDTNSVGKFKPFIKVYMPELVKVKPNKQHGKGSKILNEMEEIISNSDNSAEAGLLCMINALAGV